MAEKLKSISKRIHWSSLLKAAVFAGAWLFSPFWVFVPVALYLYFIPWFRAGRLLMPFLALLLLTGNTSYGLFMAIAFGVLFYGILIVKDLLILDRRSAHEIILFAITLLYVRHFYGVSNMGVTGAALLSAFFAGGVIALLFRNFVATSLIEEKGIKNFVPPALQRSTFWLIFFVVTQILVAGLFLPLDFIYQSIVAFLIIVPLIDLTAEYFFGSLNRNKILGLMSVTFALLAVIFTSVHWG